MLGRQKTCDSCEKRIEKGARFCPYCGAPQGDNLVACGQCDAPVPADAKFCPQCGHDMGAVAPPDVRQNRWSRREGDLAARFDTSNVAGFFSSPLIVEPGTQVVLLADGRNLGVQGPGRYTLDTLSDKMARSFNLEAAARMTAVVIDTESIDLDFTVDGVFTQDPLRVGLRVRLTAQIDDPLQFYTTLVRSRVRFSRDDLHQFLYGEVSDAVQEWIGERTVQELAVQLDLKYELETHIEQYLDRTFARNGLAFNQLRTMNYLMEHVDRVRGVEEEYLIRATEMDTELAGRKKVFEIFQEEQLQEMAEETQKVEQYERKAQVRRRMRQAVLSDKFDEIENEQEMEAFLRQVDKDDLIAEDEWDRFKRAIQWRRDDDLQERKEELEDNAWARSIVLEDRERDRAHLLARIELENRFELRQMELLQQMDLEPEEMQHEQEMARQRLENEFALAAKRQEFELSQQQQQAEFKREQQQLDDILRRERALQDTQNRLAIELQQAQNQAEIERIQREQDQAEAEMAILLLEKMKAVSRKDEEERELLRLQVKEQEMEIDLQIEQRRLEMALQRQQAEHEQTMARQAQEQQFELDWMETLKGMAPAELAVAARETERAQIIQDMQRTDAMSGMSEQQILAMMVENRPEAAEALAEIARAAAEGGLGEEQREMYERLLTQTQQLAEQRKGEADRLDDIRREQGERDKEMMFKALDSQRDASVDIARATSHPPGAESGSTVIVTGQGGATYTAGGEGASGQLRCPKCSEVVRADANFCPNCRHKLRGDSE